MDPRRSQIDFSLRCMFPKWSDWDIKYTRRGVIKARISKILKFLAFAATLVGIYWLQKSGVGLPGITSSLSAYLRAGVSRLLLPVYRGIHQL